MVEERTAGIFRRMGERGKKIDDDGEAEERR